MSETESYATSTDVTGTDATSTDVTGTDATTTDVTTTDTTTTDVTTTDVTTTDATTDTEITELATDVTETLTLISEPPPLLEDGDPAIHPLPEDLLRKEGRHIKSEDFSWGISPVATLADIILEAVCNIEGPDVEKVLKGTTTEQRERFLEILPLDLPPKITLPLLEEGTYWKRMCLRSWPASDIWRYSDSWKCMFVQRSVQELIEKFIPDEDSIWDLCENVKIFSTYVTSLQICKLIKATEKDVSIDVSVENFDEQLDEIVAAAQDPIYLDFKKLFECLLQLQDLTIQLSPKCIDWEDFYFNIADFNIMFRGLRQLHHLKKFRISNGTFTNEQLTVFLKMFLTHSNLTELNLSYNFIDSDTCDYVAKLLLSDCPLECLILKCNKITDEGAKSIAAALSENSKLLKLDLSLNMIGDEGGCFLATTLLLNNSVTDLDVSKNKMTFPSGIVFAELVRNSEILRSFKIEENLLGETAGRLFLEAIADNFHLLELDVRFCDFRSEEEGAIHQAVLRNRRMEPYEFYIKNKDIPAAEFLF